MSRMSAFVARIAELGQGPHRLTFALLAFVPQSLALVVLLALFAFGGEKHPYRELDMRTAYVCGQLDIMSSFPAYFPKLTMDQDKIALCAPSKAIASATGQGSNR